MNKYNKIMDRVRVDDDMKKRILENLEKELSAEKELHKSKAHNRRKIIEFRKYAAIAAVFALLFVGTYAVFNVGVFDDKTATMESATEAPAMEESATEATMESAEATEEATIETAMESTDATAKAESEEYTADSMNGTEMESITESDVGNEVAGQDAGEAVVEDVEPETITGGISDSKAESAEQEEPIESATQQNVIYHICVIVVIIIILCLLVAFVVWRHKKKR
ncbi:hypothetical protein [Butyrivibrio sp. YAB3001]|uniref:hypothetical protein n=1 Tax=Butyrivibrio sp. YAB3001 TaxID=1520812 RepID=UPI001130E927|nr:hypothetical protein [Butyrivibrio sp. YAB3001]